MYLLFIWRGTQWFWWGKSISRAIGRDGPSKWQDPKASWFSGERYKVYLLRTPHPPPPIPELNRNQRRCIRYASVYIKKEKVRRTRIKIILIAFSLTGFNLNQIKKGLCAMITSKKEGPQWTQRCESAQLLYWNTSIRTAESWNLRNNFYYYYYYYNYYCTGAIFLYRTRSDGVYMSCSRQYTYLCSPVLLAYNWGFTAGNKPLIRTH